MLNSHRDHSAAAINRKKVPVSGVVVDAGMKCVAYEDKVCRLNPKQIQILTLLLESSPRLLSGKQLYDEIYWNDPDGGPNPEILRVHICHLRKRLAKAGIPVNIYTSAHMGYWAEMAFEPVRCRHG